MSSKLTKKFMVKPGEKVKLDKIDPSYRGPFKDKLDAQAATRENIKRLFDLQYLMYAENKHSLLIVLQAMDAAGKDGVIRHVMRGLNPQGCRVQPFKKPSTNELDHDFLWRIHQAVPAKGDIGIFNRSHYEDVLVVRVHDLVPKSIWSQRYDMINAFEKNLSLGNMTILKFFLHISKDEQKERFQDRIDVPEKHWKLSQADINERAFWDDYQDAYEDVFRRCSTKHAPWFIIPANRKWFRNYAVSQIIVDTLEDLDMKFPRPAVDVKKLKLV